MTNTKESLKVALFSSLVSSAVLLAALVFAWSEPTQAPPGCPAGQPGCDAPLNVGPTSQVKNGGLGMNTLAVYGQASILGSLNMNSQKVTNLLAATADSDAVNFGQLKSYVGAQGGGGGIKVARASGWLHDTSEVLHRYRTPYGGAGFTVTVAEADCGAGWVAVACGDHTFSGHQETQTTKYGIAMGKLYKKLYDALTVSGADIGGERGCKVTTGCGEVSSGICYVNPIEAKVVAFCLPE